MKKTLIIAASILAIAGCKKAELITEQGQEDLITRKVSLAAEVAPESDDATVKSFFDTGDKYVKLTGAEELAVAYSNADPDSYHPKENKPIVEGIIKGTSDGSSNYTFSHNAITDATKYNYYFILPYRDTKNINTNSTNTGLYVKLDSIQHPTATSFDPLQDYIMGQPILDAEAQTNITAEKLKLKRLFALVRVTLSDGENALGGEPLQKVSISFPAATDNKQDGWNHKKNNLINLCYLKFDKDFSEAGLSGYGDWGKTHASASVTAEYAEGLAAGTDGKYTVWYVTMPVQKAKDTKLTVVAQSKNKKVTRTIDLPSDMKLQTGRIINDLKINITGDGYKVEDSADPNDYWSIYNAGQDIVAGGMTINKSTHKNATLLSGTQITNADLEKGGLIFVDGSFSSTGHLKLANGSIIIGRYKDSQPSITMNSSRHAIYLDNGNLVLKNLNIGGTTTAGRLIVISKNDKANSSEYAIIEDCTITAPKNVCGYASDTPKYVIKNLTFDNCIIKMAGTDANYAVININKLAAANTDSNIYKNIEKFEISNCVVYAEKPYENTGRRMLMDLGSGEAGKYDFPLEKTAIVVNNNTLYNINCNGGVIARAYYANSADVNGNVVYNDYSTIAATETFTASYMFGIYSGFNNPSNGVYNVNNNYSYGYYTSEQATYVEKTLSNTTVKFKYRKSEKDKTTGTVTYYSPDYNTNNSKQENGQVPNYPFTTVDMAKGYFPVNSANIQKATGASYDTKPWVK